MDISRFFIERPRFAAVLSIFIFLVGLLAIFQLPISEYPDVAPPQVVVRAQFPGANPRVVSETVATPLEEQINGVDDMLYYESQATADGSLTLTVTFRIGTDPEQAETAVQNRINRALPRLPEIVRQIGVTTEKQSPNLTMVVHMVSPDESHDSLYLRNYAHQQVRDELLRIPGMGSVSFFGGGDYAMRIWLDPQKLAGRDMTAGDVVAAVREQNVQVAAGVVGAPPSPKGTDFQLAVNTQGRLMTEEEFADIIVRTDPATGALVRIRDVGRVEINSNSYAIGSLINNKEAAAIGIFQAPGSNALEISKQVRATMERLKADFPQGVDYDIVYDPTRFVQTSIDKVVHTLIEAVLLVVLVVVVFLQTWRASIIPLLAVPVSIVGTFAVLLALGYSINTLTLFGLVLAIGIVVDDAIVVVENVERNLEDGLTPHDAAVKAMREVSGPIVAIALVLCAVFIPLTLVPGLSGQFYKQFAATIAISTVISAINSLTLSPALAAILLRPHDAPKDAVMRVMDKLFGRFFRWFNGFFHRGSESYSRGVTGLLKRKSMALAVYALLLAAYRSADHAPAERLRSGARQAISDRHRAAARRRHAGAHRKGPSRDDRHRAQGAGHRGRDELPRPVDRRLFCRAQRRPGVLPARPLRGAQVARTLEGRHPGPCQQGDPVHPGRAYVRRAAACRGRPGQCRRLQDPGAGPRRPGRAGAVRGRPEHARAHLRRPRLQHRHALLQLRHQRAAALRQRRPHEGQADGRGAAGHLRHAADQSRLALRQRLQPLRQDLPGDRPGRHALPDAGAGHRRPEDAQRPRRDGAAGRADAGRADLRPDPRDALQRLPFGRHQWCAQAGFLQRRRPKPRSSAC